MSEKRTPIVPVLIAVALLAAGVGWYVAANQPQRAGLIPGTPPPSFSLTRLDGGSLSLDELRGKVVYVNLWATWCAPCREEAPALQRLYDQLHEDGFEIVAPTIDTPDDREKVIQFREEFGLRFPIVLDPDRDVYQRYGATGVPETYLVDTRGNLAEAYIGPRNWDDPRYARAIRALLPARPAGNGSGG